MERLEFCAALAGVAVSRTTPPESPLIKKGSVLGVSYTGSISPQQRMILDVFVSPLTVEEWYAKYGGNSDGNL